MALGTATGVTSRPSRSVERLAELNRVAERDEWRWELYASAHQKEHPFSNPMAGLPILSDQAVSIFERDFRERLRDYLPLT